LAKHKSLLLGNKATGSIGGNICFTTWKGIGIVKEKPEPANPKTVAQMAIRNAFSGIVDEWHDLDRTIDDSDAYDVLAGRQSKPMSGFNVFMSIYMDVHVSTNTLAYLVDGSATRVTTTVTVAATASEDIQYKAIVYNKNHVPVAEDTDTAAAGVLSIAVTVPASVTEGYAVIIADAVGNGGKSGLYSFD